MKVPEVNPNKIANSIEKKIRKSADRVLEIMDAPFEERFVSGVHEVVPFYNKFLPKFLRKTAKVEFYPNSSIKKSEVVRNHKGDIISAEYFDRLGNSTYFETYNPRTSKSFVRKMEYGARTETTYINQDMTKLEKFDSKNKLIYRETYNPKTKKKVVETDSGILKTRTEYTGSQLTYQLSKGEDGKVTVVSYNLDTGEKITIESEPEKLRNGKISKKET